MYYLETGSTDPTYNLAFEEVVLRRRTKGDYLILWQNANAIIIGRNQNTLQEINPDFVERHNIQVVRRNTGGGAVYHDLGNLNYSFITDADDADSAARFTAPVISALQQLSLKAESSGRNDILVAGQKVSGTAQQRIKNRILHHGTLLFNANTEMIAGSLNPDPEKFRSKAVKSVRSRVGNIRSHLMNDMDISAFWAHLKTTLSADGIIPTVLTANELAEVHKLQAEKYRSWQWNYGTGPKMNTVNRKRWAGGSLEIHADILKGCIEDLVIYGDFLALRPIDPIRNALIGCPYRRDDVQQILATLPLSDCLGGITAEEFLQTLF